MYLNHYGLVSSFLIFSTVLADHHPEKYRPRLLNKQNINAASDDEVDWAGASLPESNLGFYNSTTGAFTVPNLWDGNNTGISIGVSIGAMCQDRYNRFSAGIDAVLINGGITYSAQLVWGNQTKRDPGNMNITTGDFIRATIYVDSPTTGLAFLQNLSNNQTWEEGFNEETAVCQQSAEWIVAGLQARSTGIFVPMFGAVVFADATAKTGSETWSSDGATAYNMDDNNATLVASATQNDTVFLVRSMPLVDLKDDLEGDNGGSE